MAAQVPAPRGEQPGPPYHNQQPDQERLVAAALRAQARIAGRPSQPDVSEETATGDRPRRRFGLGWTLLIALVFGVLVGISLALLSLLAPGVLPAIG